MIVLCAHSMRHTGGWRRGQQVGNTIESWPRHSMHARGGGGGELATGASGWADLKRADCCRTARLLIEVSLELGLGVVGGQN